MLHNFIALQDFSSDGPDSCYYVLCFLFTTLRFADFVEGASHLAPNEVSDHEQEYGLGGSFLEDQLFEEGGGGELDNCSVDENFKDLLSQNHLTFQERTG